jgi:nucleotide-binding universal stress UspA family protein
MNPTHSPILCATDFSERAAEAALVAARMARQRNAVPLLLHVVERPTAPAFEEARRKLADLASRLEATGVVVDQILTQSAWPAREILKTVRAREPALVVMSAATKTVVDRWAFGAISEQVAQASPVPTLVIRDAAPFQGWDWAGSRLKALVALDLYTTSDAVLRWGRELRQGGPCDFIHAYANQRQPGSADASPSRPSNPATLQEKLEREIRKKVRDQLGDEDAEVLVRPVWGSPESWLVDVALDRKVDLVIVGTHRRHGLSRLFHGSVSRELMRTSGLNVVCVPVTAEFAGRDAHLREFRRVLVATDFSELGNAAIPYACGLCAIGGLVRIVHVARPARRKEARARSRELNELFRRLQDLVPDEIGARARPPEVDVLEDRDPAEAICREAERFGADAVCVASHGLGGSRALFGSVTKSVLKQIRRPILIVRRPDE